MKLTRAVTAAHIARSHGVSGRSYSSLVPIVIEKTVRLEANRLYFDRSLGKWGAGIRYLLPAFKRSRDLLAQ